MIENRTKKVMKKQTKEEGLQKKRFCPVCCLIVVFGVSSLEKELFVGL